MGEDLEHAQERDAAESTAGAEPAGDGGSRQIVGAGTRRSLLAAAAGAAGAFIAQALGRPAPVDAADVVLGATNSATTETTFRNTAASASAKALVGRTTYTGAANQSRAVMGIASGQNGVGVYGEAPSGTDARAVYGTAAQGIGVRGVGGITGVRGTGANYGIKGESANNYGAMGTGGYTGVFGSGPYGIYGSGNSAGAIGTSGPGYGLYGLGSIGAVGIGDGNGYGVWGYNADSGGYGVVGQGGYRGVYGSGGNAAIYGTSPYVGVWGAASSTSGLNFGVYAHTHSSGGYAGVFSGAVQVSGFLSKLGGGFKIDHPLEPATRYLVHSFVESPEMMNVYSGVAKLGANGRATVRLPRYFEAANRDHRYQLTPIGGAAPNLHVASKVKNNAFTIAGGPAGLEVSWSVTGVRQDAWAKANPLEDEPSKSTADRGKFLAPTVYGKAASEGIFSMPEPLAPMSQRTPAPLAPLPAIPDDAD